MENIVSIAFAPDGVHVLTGGRDNTARLWDSTTGQLVREFMGHTNIIWNVAFAADGRHAVTASLDKTARLWDVATGQQVRVFLGHRNAAVGSATLSPDGHSAAIGSFDGVTQLMDTDVHALITAVCARALRDFTADERRIYSIRDDAPTCR